MMGMNPMALSLDHQLAVAEIALARLSHLRSTRNMIDEGKLARVVAGEAVQIPKKHRVTELGAMTVAELLSPGRPSRRYCQPWISHRWISRKSLSCSS